MHEEYGNAQNATLVLILVVIGAALACSSHDTPEEALQDFYSNPRPEETLMDPLILAGEEVVPLVTEHVRDREMPRRRYAITFLGNGRFRDALSALETILADETERDLFRGDALLAIYRIDRSQGLLKAGQSQERTDFLGQMAREVLAETEWVRERRGYLAAWLGSLD